MSSAYALYLDKSNILLCGTTLISNSLPNDKILDLSNLKELVDNKINVTEKLKFVLGRKENFVGKDENACYQHFLLFLQCFQKVTSPGSLKVEIMQQRTLKSLPNDKILEKLEKFADDKLSVIHGKFSFANSFSLEESKFCLLGKS